MSVLLAYSASMFTGNVCRYSRMGYYDEVTRGNEDWERFLLSVVDGVKEKMRIGADFLLHNLGLACGYWISRTVGRCESVFNLLVVLGGVILALSRGAS